MRKMEIHAGRDVVSPVEEAADQVVALAVKTGAAMNAPRGCLGTPAARSAELPMASESRVFR